MSENIKLSDISLSLYSMPFSVGFIKKDSFNSSNNNILDIYDVATFTKEIGLGGIEFPIDTCFPQLEISQLYAFFNKLGEYGLKYFIDFENFSSVNVNKTLPIFHEMGVKFIRVKVSNFYGGNRHTNQRYYSDLISFDNNLKMCVDSLRKLGIKILVENHQDVVVHDILNFVEKYGSDVVGVNWDIGNSLPSGETPDSFLAKTKELISNIHIKDYKLYKCEDGYSMVRCPIGDGFVNFKDIFKKLTLHQAKSMTIELGAHNYRTAFINDSEYWEHTKGISLEEKNNFLEFIKNNLSCDHFDFKKPNNLDYVSVSKKEIHDIRRSVDYLKEIL